MVIETVVGAVYNERNIRILSGKQLGILIRNSTPEGACFVVADKQTWNVEK
jgi:hypothetical protein